MKKIFSWIWDNFLFLETLFLLAFIPLYPKIPLLGVQHTWVYIRVEDFMVLFVLLSWLALLIKKKITLKTPLTLPMLIFWIIGAVSTTHAVLLVFPGIPNVFPNVAFLALVRHVEYMSLFFIAYHGIKDKRLIPVVVAVLVATLIGIIGYGFGQRYLGFPAFLTMNEEFAKGVPIYLSQLSRIPSTFAGQYDLAAYLVLILPIVVSMAFGFKNWLVKIFLLGVSALGFVLLFMTVSRVSLFALLAGLFIVFLLQKKKLLFLAIPAVAIFAIFLISFQPSLLARFQNTVKEVNVLVDAKTGDAIGNVTFVPRDYFKDKLVLKRRANNKEELTNALTGQGGLTPASPSAVLPFEKIPVQAPLVLAANISTGETLPQGTGYINLALSPVERRLSDFYYELPPNLQASSSAQVLVLEGDYIVKRAGAYDLSFTTRFQGEWPRAIEAFQRNILFGSGYSSVTLAVDNNYFRMLGEVGLLGFISFIVIFLSIGIYIKKTWEDIDSSTVRSFVIGFSAGVVGLALNATLIDVFEASKIAFTLWILSGITLGTLVFYQKNKIDLLSEIKKAATSTYAVASYIIFLGIILFAPMLNDFFVGDDFTWFRWAANAPASLLQYFTQSDGFFYRPATKIYFYLMYNTFWLNPVVYHAVSLALHLGVTILFFILAKKIFKNVLLAGIAAFVFLILSGYAEVVFWIAATGSLATAFFGLLGLVCFIEWDEKKNPLYFIISIASFTLALFFHELGVVLPLLVVVYKLKDYSWTSLKNIIKRFDFLALFIPVLAYLCLRFIANSHWQGGDYSYSLIKLPFNVAGNILGYISLTFLGQSALPFYEKLRDITKVNLLIPLALIPIVLIVLYVLYKKIFLKFEKDEKGVILFGIFFFLVSLLPFLGLGNIASRYSYLASFGLVIVFVLLLRRVYLYLLSNGKEIALSVVALLVILYSLFQIIQVQQSYSDWSGAGAKVKQFFISVDSSYSDFWSRIPVEFHFVNVPLKVGEAWVFPVGLNDAIWFAFKNPQAKVFIHNDVQSALKQAGISSTNRVFVFQDDGSVKEIFYQGKLINNETK
jgi:hypothetical protein